MIATSRIVPFRQARAFRKLLPERLPSSTFSPSLSLLPTPFSSSASFSTLRFQDHKLFTIKPLVLPLLQIRDFTITAAKMSENPAMNGGNFNHNNTVAPEYTDRVLPLFSLKGRTAIVSGAGAGIGLAVAHALAEAGANVAIWYNSNKKAIAEAEKVEKTFGVKCKLFCQLLSKILTDPHVTG